MHTINRYTYDEPKALSNIIVQLDNTVLRMSACDHIEALHKENMEIITTLKGFGITNDRKRAHEKIKNIKLDLRASPSHLGERDRAVLHKGRTMIFAQVISWFFLAIGVISAFFLIQGIAVENVSWILVGFFSAVVSLISGFTGLAVLNRSAQGGRQDVSARALNPA